MKKFVALTAFIVLAISCFSSIAFGQASETAEKRLTLQLGVDAAVLPGGFYTGYHYNDNGDIYQSGSKYQSGYTYGGSLQVTHRPGWPTEFRYRRSSLDKPLFWFEEFGNTFYNDGTSSNAVTSYSAHFSALDIEQLIPIVPSKIWRHGVSISAIAGVSNVHASTHQITDIMESGVYHDDATITHALWGPKGGGRLSYRIKGVQLTTEATLGYLHEHGGYTDVQVDHLPSGEVDSFPTFFIEGTTWSWEKNWRNTLEVRITSHLSLRLTHEMRSIDNSNPNYLFKSPDNPTTLQFTGSNVLMGGLTFRL